MHESWRIFISRLVYIIIGIEKKIGGACVSNSSYVKIVAKNCKIVYDLRTTYWY